MLSTGSWTYLSGGVGMGLVVVTGSDTRRDEAVGEWQNQRSRVERPVKSNGEISSPSLSGIKIDLQSNLGHERR